MIEGFLASWALFRDAYLAAWLIAGVLGAAGVWIVARDQIFLGAAVAQASTFGVALGMWLAPRILPESGSGESLLLFGASSVFAIAAAWSPARSIGRSAGSNESLVGWVFLAASSGAVLVMSRSPHGLEEVHRLLASSLVGATSYDVALFAGLAVATVLGLYGAGRPLLFHAMEPEVAEALDGRGRVYSAVLAIGLGIVVAQAIRVSGTLYAFGCLVLPALAVRGLGREALPLFWKAPALAVAAAMISSVLADQWDLPPAQLTVAFLAVVTALTWPLRR